MDVTRIKVLGGAGGGGRSEKRGKIRGAEMRWVGGGIGNSLLAAVDRDTRAGYDGVMCEQRKATTTRREKATPESRNRQQGDGCAEGSMCLQIIRRRQEGARIEAGWLAWGAGGDGRGRYSAVSDGKVAAIGDGLNRGEGSLWRYIDGWNGACTYGVYEMASQRSASRSEGGVLSLKIRRCVC